MDFEVVDFNGAERYYHGSGAREWTDLNEIVTEMPLYLQGSLQAGRIGSAVFDPKATNLHLKGETQARGWRTIPVPRDLKAFGNDWDGGKSETLAEWQFSNYPFLCNNCTRSEIVHKTRLKLPEMSPIKGLIIVTKSGLFPAAQSSLYFEQAEAQLASATALGIFTIPIRLVGLTNKSQVVEYEAVWTEYADRTSRTALRKVRIRTKVTWTAMRKFGNRSARFTSS